VSLSLYGNCEVQFSKSFKRDRGATRASDQIATGIANNDWLGDYDVDLPCWISPDDFEKIT
jgi:hypothetical protein